MFENIQFYTYEIEEPVTPNKIDIRHIPRLKQEAWQNAVSHPLLFLEEFGTSDDLPANMQHADFLITGKLQSFFRPPISEFALQNLYHLEAFSIFHCGRNFFTKRSEYASYLILYTYNGNGILEYEGKKYHLGEGDGFLIDCMKPHMYKTTGDNWTHSVLHINGPLISPLFEQYMQNGSALFSQSITGNYQSSLERLLTIYSTAQPYRDWQASHCLSAILTDLLASSLHSSDKSVAMPENMQYLIGYMENNFSADLTVEYLSKFSGISRSHLTREFKKYTGYAPNDYLIQLRIEQAKKLLESSQFSANQIAHMVGIHDVNNFTNLFRKKVGMTPGRYRKEQAL